MKIKYLFFFALMLSSTCLFAQKQYTLESPNANITITIDAGDDLTYSVSHGSTQVLAPSPIAMKLDNGKILGENPKVISTKSNSVNEIIKANFYKKNEIVQVMNLDTNTVNDVSDLPKVPCASVNDLLLFVNPDADGENDIECYNIG